MIDVDGPGGADPMNVQCVMETIPASASVSVKNQFPQPMAPCTAPGCNILDITYKDVTLKQMKALTEASEQCSQTLGLACINAPIFDSANNIAMIVWDDVNGVTSPYWTGNDTHRCLCGMHGTCIMSSKCFI